MDPNEALKVIRDRINRVASATSNDEEIKHLREIIDHFQALDDWVSRGGFLPGDWQQYRVGPPNYS